MSSGERELAARLKGYLDRSAEDLRPGLAYRLQSARAEALSRLSDAPRTAPIGGLVGAHGLAGGLSGLGIPGRHPRPLLGRARVWVGVLAIAAAALGYHQWTVWAAAQEKGGLDAEILASELPIDAYLDRGFQNWLSAPRDDE